MSATGEPSPPAASSTGSGARDWRDLRLRLLSAAVLAPAAIGAVLLGGWWFAALVAVLAVGLGTEWAGLLGLPLRGLRGLVCRCWPAVAVAAALGTGRWVEAAFVLLPASLVLGPAVGGGMIAIGWGALALLWLRLGVAGLGIAGPGMVGGEGVGWAAVLFLVLVVWSSDSAAYAVGRAVGGAKLAPRISPGKTRSGAVGGLVGAAATGLCCALLLPHAVAGGRIVLAGWVDTAARGAAAGTLLGLCAQAGDLAESAFKRRCGAKDSGRLIPGHGGLLDRLDGLLAAAPVAALLSLAGPHGAGFWYAGS
ncbi:MAG: phosphatidate cytidylyltransferase [Gluconacetobacter diazotrophicus]|nr:phosphatidate cytidylyltransferase [Gluconacetobacter diazotrophicus]